MSNTNQYLWNAGTVLLCKYSMCFVALPLRPVISSLCYVQVPLFPDTASVLCQIYYLFDQTIV